MCQASHGYLAFPRITQRTISLATRCACWPGSRANYVPACDRRCTRNDTVQLSGATTCSAAAEHRHAVASQGLWLLWDKPADGRLVAGAVVIRSYSRWKCCGWQQLVVGGPDRPAASDSQGSVRGPPPCLVQQHWPPPQHAVADARACFGPHFTGIFAFLFARPSPMPRHSLHDMQQIAFLLQDMEQLTCSMQHVFRRGAWSSGTHYW